LRLWLAELQGIMAAGNDKFNAQHGAGHRGCDLCLEHNQIMKILQGKEQL